MAVGIQDRNKKKRGGALADINVTPLVDILLVLLIIFMVTAPTIHHGARLPTPDIQPTDDKQPSPKEVEKDTLLLDKEGNLKFRGKTVTLEQMATLVKQDKQLQSTRELYLQTDLDLTYGRVMEVIGKMRRAGIRKLGVVVDANELGIQPTPPKPRKKK